MDVAEQAHAGVRASFPVADGHCLGPLVTAPNGASSFQLALSARALAGWPRGFVELYEALAASHGIEAVVELLCVVPRGFPRLPPSLRLLRPRLQPGTGGVVNGALRSPALAPEGWDPAFSLALALACALEAIAAGGPVLETHGAPAFYCAAAALASERRLQHARAAPRHYDHPHAFGCDLTVFSGAWAARTMGLALPRGFESGNKALAPAALLELLVRGEVAAGDGGGGGGSDATGEPGAPPPFLESDAMVLELAHSGSGLASYVGVADFCVPHGDVLVLPRALMRSLGAREGTRVALRRVRPPPVAAITLQPHRARFFDERSGGGGDGGASAACLLGGVAGTGLTAREFLEAALTRHASLQPGDVIVCDAAGVNDAVDYAADIASMFASDGGGGGGGRGGGGGGSPALLARVDDDELAALLQAGVTVDELAASARLAGAHDERAQWGGAPDDGAAAGAGGADDVTGTAFCFTVVAVQPADAPAVALWASFRSEVAIDLLPAADEFLVPRLPPAAAVWRQSAPSSAPLPAEAATCALPLLAEVAAGARAEGGAAAGGGGDGAGGSGSGGGGHPLRSASSSSSGSGSGSVSSFIRHLPPSASAVAAVARGSGGGAGPAGVAGGADDRGERRRRAADAAARRSAVAAS